MAEVEELPVEHGDRARLGRVEHQVVEPVSRRARPNLALVARAGRHVRGSHSIRRSIASIGCVIEAWYCLVQRPIWRSK
jgi:hypothetical protein